jgi:thiol-disulfide isomerase/thioredoxin
MSYCATACLLLFATAAWAQAPASPAEALPKPATRIHLTSQTLVMDSTGKALPIAVWRPLLEKGGYQLLPAPGSSAQQPAYRVVARPRLGPPAASPFFTTGQALAPFQLRDLTGRSYSSRELRGKIVVLNFWFIGCPPCRQEIPALNQLVQQNARRPDVLFLAVALDPAADVQAYVQDHPYAYALVPDGRAVAARYGITSFPTNVVLDRQGNVVFHAQIHPNMATYLQQAIDAAK